MDNRRYIGLGLATLVCLAFGCGDNAAGKGTVLVSLSGERAAEEGYPVGEGEDMIAFADGYHLKFESVLVSLTEMSFSEAQDAVATLDVDPVVVELVDGPQLSYSFVDVEAARYRNVEFLIAPATRASRPVGEVDEDDLSTMAERGYALWVRGSATDGDETYRFDLGFETAVRSVHCKSGLDDTDGVVVVDNASVEVEVSIHLDHLWFDSYAYDGAPLRFEPWAAVADDDGLITLEALEGQALSDVIARDGTAVLNADGELVVYDPGPLAVEPRDLRAFVTAAATTIGHFNGEGHCDYSLQ